MRARVSLFTTISSCVFFSSTDSSPLSLDPDTANRTLILSDNNRKVTWTCVDQRYADNPKRFTSRFNVLSKESFSVPRYIEVDCSGGLFGGFGIAVSQDDINRKDEDLSEFGHSPQSWMLFYSDRIKKYTFRHNRIKTAVSGPVRSTREETTRYGVYVDPSAGVLCFYHVSGNTMSLLHTERTSFTPPLYLGIYVNAATAEVCEIW